MRKIKLYSRQKSTNKIQKYLCANKLTGRLENIFDFYFLILAVNIPQTCVFISTWRLMYFTVMHSACRQLKIRHFASCANNAQNVKFQSLRTSLTRSFEIFDWTMTDRLVYGNAKEFHIASPCPCVLACFFLLPQLNFYVQFRNEKSTGCRIDEVENQHFGFVLLPMTTENTAVNTETSTEIQCNLTM